MGLTPAAASAKHDWVRARADVVVLLVDKTRQRLGEQSDTRISAADKMAYHEAVGVTFADDEIGVNVAAYVYILEQLDMQDDYPGFVVNEVLGRELMATVVGGGLPRLLAQAMFHFVGVAVHIGSPAGCDNLDAALVAGFRTYLPGWS